MGDIATMGKQDCRNLLFTSPAYAKIMKLVSSYQCEIAWQGTVERQKEKGLYIVNDILVYPQTVTSVTVDTDEEKYGKWMAALSNEVFNSMRFQGHSHVDMGVSPSGTDDKHQKMFVEQLTDGDFYIFIIINKKGDIYTKIYEKNGEEVLEFGDNQVFVDVGVNGKLLSEFKKESDKLVEREVPKYPTYQSLYGKNYGKNYTGSGSYYGGGYWDEFYYGGTSKKKQKKKKAFQILRTLITKLKTCMEICTKKFSTN